MRAATYERYGTPDVVQLTEVAKPTPKDEEVLIKIHATTVSSGDWRARSLSMPPGFGLLGRLVFGVRRPRQRIMGTELAGEIEETGKAVRNFKVGDSVFAFPGGAMGCHAQYRAMRADGPIAHKPAGIGYAEAAALSFGGATALAFLRRGKVQAGEEVLVNGAAGCVGTAAVQIAKHLGATVTGVCSTANLDLVRSIGADRVIDYTKEDFTASAQRYDVVVDTAGTAPYWRSKTVLKDSGRLLLVLGRLSDLIKAPWVSMTSRRRVIAGPASVKQEDLRLLASLADAGSFRPVVDRTYDLEQIVDAHTYVDKGHKRGSVVVTVGHDGPHELATTPAPRPPPSAAAPEPGTAPLRGP